MRKLLLLLTFLYFGFTNAQIVNIPDANFKTRLLDASSDNETAIDGTGNYFKIDANDDGEIQESEALAVSQLNLSVGEISNMTGIESFMNMILLNCNSNQISSIDISQNVNLEYFYISGNALAALDVSQNINLRVFSFGVNSISSIDLSQNPLIRSLYCYYNLLTNLDVSHNTNLHNLWCNDNLLTSINLNENSLLDTFICENNQLTSLDVSANFNLRTINCSSNQLETLNIKNGYNDEYINLSDNPNLAFICVDDIEVTTIEDLVSNSTVINSYCSFTPGGNFNAINGSLVFDSYNNGCDIDDLPALNAKVDIDNGSDQGVSIANTLGEYVFYTQNGDFTLTPSIENPDWFTISPESIIISFTNNENNEVIQNFCVTSNGVHSDVEIVILPIVPAQPGFNAVYRIVYKNKGNQAMSDSINFTYHEDGLDFVSASVIPSSQNTGNLTWNYSDLVPFESRSITVTLNVNSPTETPAVNIGDELGFVATIEPISGDETPSDNEFSYKQTVIGSYDPNDKICLEGDVISPDQIGKYLHYTINFENTGTAAATFVVVKDEIDETQYDMSTLQIMDASHDLATTSTGNKIEFIFDNINLGPDEKGYVVFKIKTLNTLQTGDTASNKADIFFDYNFPIETNLASTTFQNLSISEFDRDNSVTLFPNPVNDVLNIKAKSNIKSMSLFDLQGRAVFTKIINTTQSTIDMSSINSGVYVLKVKTESGEHTEKLIKD